MADDHYSSKRKYDDPSPPPRRTGFSSGPPPASPPAGAPSYNSVPPPPDEIQLAKQRAQEIAARIFNAAEAKRPRVDNGDDDVGGYGGGGSLGGSGGGGGGGGRIGGGGLGFSSSAGGGHGSSIPPLSSQSGAPQYSSYGGYQGTSKKIEIPNGRVGVIIGKAGETIRYLQLQSGAKIQVTRDTEAEPGAQTRPVELSGTPEQISKAEQLIKEVLAEADAGSSGTGSGGRKYNAPQPGADTFQMKIANNKVGLVIGKGGETIKSMQAKSGARIQDIASGQSILFAPRLPADYAVWMGEIKPLSYFRDTYKVDMVFYVDEITHVVQDHFGDHGKPLLFLLYGKNTDSGNFSKPANFEGMEKFDTDSSTLHPILTECRVIKSDLELAVIQYANDISSETLSAVLHYGHAAAPNDRTLNDGDMALMDMGAEYHFYGSDITCSYPINGKFSSSQIVIYNAVLKAHNDVISHMLPGVNYMDMHKLAERAILESLKKEQILQGIDTHDPGGYPEGLERPKEPGLSSLRTTRELKEGMVITVEPGCYFIDTLLTKVRNDPISSKFSNWQEIEKYKSFGGVRIESDVYVTAQGCRNLTNCPRETWEIKAVMAGAPWPPRASTSPAAAAAESGV